MKNTIPVENERYLISISYQSPPTEMYMGVFQNFLHVSLQSAIFLFIYVPWYFFGMLKFCA